jgi:hypothetical protein
MWPGEGMRTARLLLWGQHSQTAPHAAAAPRRSPVCLLLGLCGSLSLVWISCFLPWRRLH